LIDATTFRRLVVDGVLGVSEIEDDDRVGLSATAAGKFVGEINGAVEAKAAVVEQVDVESLVVGRSVNQTDLASLDEVVRDDEVLLIGSDLNVVRSNAGLLLIGVIETLDVVEVTNVKGSDVVGSGEGQVDEFAIRSDVGAGDRTVSIHRKTYMQREY
jgi:hypothetical protein